MYDHVRQETRFAGPHYLFYEPHSVEYAAALPAAAMGPLIDHIQTAPPGAYVPLLFPNLGLAATESTFSTFHIEPVSPTRTRVHLRSKGMPLGAWGSFKAMLGGGVSVRSLRGPAAGRRGSA
jgi:Rieske 2Fe-2S family protein